MQKTILVVDDDKMNLRRTRLILEKNYDILTTESGQEALDILKNEKVDLILLDIDMPGMSGIETFERMKERNIEVPVIFLTARGNVDDRIKGLKLGADDYIVKPFQVGELIARVEAVLRRYGKAGQKLAFADVEIDVVSRTVTQAGVPVELTIKEFDLLVELMQNKNVALYRERIYEKVWGGSFMGDTRTLDSHIQRLRKKLGWENYIRTVFRIGYRLEDDT